jgi:hypothetical protein
MYELIIALGDTAGFHRHGGRIRTRLRCLSVPCMAQASAETPHGVWQDRMPLPHDLLRMEISAGMEQR